MKIETSIGEIVDKLSILNIKKNNIKDETKLINISKEYDYLFQITFDELKIEESDFYDLVIINERLWDIEDSIRDKERDSSFDSEFIELARSVYKTNDRRSKMKMNINILFKFP
jgi:hypothetical protein